MKKYLRAFLNPITQINVMILGFLILVQVIHTRAHHTLETDVHGHVHRALKANPEMARSACYELD